MGWKLHRDAEKRYGHAHFYRWSWRENIHQILYRLVMTSYIYSLVMWPPCQHTKGLLVGPLPWKKSGRETGKKCQGTQQERKSRKDSKLRHHFRDTHTLGTVQLTHTKEAHHEV